MFACKNYFVASVVIASIFCLSAIAQDYKAVWNKAYNLVRKNENDQAIDVLSKGIAADPESGELYYLRGALRAEKEQYKDALEDQVKVLDYSNDKNFAAAAFLSKAKLEFLLKQNDAADRDYRKIVEFEPDLPIVHYEYATFLFRTSKSEKAFLHIKQCKKLEKNEKLKNRNAEIKNLLEIADTGKYAKRAAGLIEINQQEKAISVLSDGIAMTPRDAELYSMRGILLAFKGRIQEADADFKKAIEIDPKQSAKLNKLLEDAKKKKSK
ncbi:MAG: tetratricopeptide repeat protein [Candidatus Melainabacteria bacterium]|nr:tetratricopeptide repeat protein [Candidatus Melainabacteria bacterium]